MEHLDRSLTQLRTREGETEKVRGDWGTVGKEKFKVPVFPIKIPTAQWSSLLTMTMCEALG